MSMQGRFGGRGLLGSFVVALLGLSVVFGALAWWKFGGVRGAMSIWAGAGVMGFDIATTLWLLRQMLQPGPGTKSSRFGLAFIFLLKLLVLFGLTYYVLAVSGLNALGFVAGSMIALGALSWSVIRQTATD